jgi:hypothetical protein
MTEFATKIDLGRELLKLEKKIAKLETRMAQLEALIQAQEAAAEALLRTPQKSLGDLQNERTVPTDKRSHQTLGDFQRHVGDMQSGQPLSDEPMS